MSVFWNVRSQTIDFTTSQIIGSSLHTEQQVEDYQKKKEYWIKQVFSIIFPILNKGALPNDRTMNFSCMHHLDKERNFNFNYFTYAVSPRIALSNPDFMNTAEYIYLSDRDKDAMDQVAKMLIILTGRRIKKIVTVITAIASALIGITGCLIASQQCLCFSGLLCLASVTIYLIEKKERYKVASDIEAIIDKFSECKLICQKPVKDLSNSGIIDAMKSKVSFVTTKMKEIV